MIRIALGMSILVTAGACSSSPETTADPAKVERLLASLEAKADPRLSPETQHKLQHADRLAGMIARVEPKRIDPKLAVALIAR